MLRIEFPKEEAEIEKWITAIRREHFVPSKTSKESIDIITGYDLL